MLLFDCLVKEGILTKEESLVLDKKYKPICINPYNRELSGKMVYFLDLTNRQASIEGEKGK